MGAESVETRPGPVSVSVTLRSEPSVADAPDAPPASRTPETGLSVPAASLSATPKSAAATVPDVPALNVTSIDVLLFVSASKSGVCTTASREDASYALGVGVAASATPDRSA